MTDYALTPALRVYRRVLALLLPRRFRERFSHQMLAVFAELESEARARAGTRGVVAALLSELPGLFRLAARERRAERAARARLPNVPQRKGIVLESLTQDI